jgi:hypothetical protein
MNIFISYSSKYRSVADSINVKLRGEGHTVFFDKDDLPPAESYDASIRKAITDCDLFVFLISPESIATNSYAFTELRFARDKWKSPVGHLLPVVVSETKMEDMPAYLSAVSILTPQGNLVAEVLAEVARLRRQRITKTMMWGGGVVMFAFVAGTIILIPDGDAVPEKCHLSLTLRLPDVLYGNLPRAYVTVRGTTDNIALSQQGGDLVDIQLGPYEPWMIEVVDSQKVLIESIDMRGCPLVPMEKTFDGDIHFSIKPQ